MNFIDRLLQAGVNINNFQEVFEFFLQGQSEGVGQLEFDQALQNLNLIIEDIKQSLRKKIEIEQLNSQLSEKLDKASYIQHFKGVFLSEQALKLAIPLAADGDYAHVDAGAGELIKVYVWDATDNDWFEQKGGTGAAANTDQVTEGQTNLYFSAQRVLNVLLTGLNIPAVGESITNTDTFLSAFGKLQAQYKETEQKKSKQTVLDVNNSDDDHYPSSKAVVDLFKTLPSKGSGSGSSVHFISIVGTEGSVNYNNDGATAVNAIAIGGGSQSTAESAVAFGDSSNSAADHTVAVGGSSSATGSKAIAIGQAANASKNYSIALGFGALVGGVGSQAFGTTANASSHYCVALGYGSAVTANYQIQLGGTSTTTFAYGAVQDRSDIRDKSDIQNVELGLDFIKRLRPVKYRWDYRDDYANELYPVPLRQNFEDDESYIAAIEENKAARANFFRNPQKDGSKVRERFHHGLIAQELKQTLDELGVDHAAYQDHSVLGGLDVKSIGYSELIPNLIKAIQELSTEVDNLREQVNN
ncbi:tail fiber domain-containing protein [Acinetobacter seifertii]|uniref:tail fiber domain-containing protein n=1 Tax=Acinetobacter seifertii TaxID=1530123 RepID=UPI0019030189|nr:tail fiber domain-containing protein [Acinetobacter seifertii]MBJ9425220.1 tail fiber domain-containing protein [Acinetobacter seifertii]